MKRLKAFYLVLMSLAFTPAIGSSLVPFTKLFSEPERYKKRYVSVRGYVGVDSLGHQYLFGTIAEARTKNYADSLDLMPLLGSDRGVPRLRDLACAELYGKFESWADYVTTDYFLSKVGGLRVKLVSGCASQSGP